LKSALPLVLLAVVADVADVVVETTFCGLDLLLRMRAQEEVHGDEDGFEDYFGQRDCCRRLFWAGCGALPLFIFFICLAVVLVKKLG
jgi:hypothetical protein